MAQKPIGKDQKTAKRLNRVTGLGDAIGKAIDPVFRKRGFASRDIVSNWAAMAPVPYDKLAIPDKLVWPRGEAGADGAILFLRCAESQRLALSHEGAAIAAAVNRYFGYLLVGAVKISSTPFSSSSDQTDKNLVEPSAETRQTVDQALENVEDDGLKSALRQLGHSLLERDK